MRDEEGVLAFCPSLGTEVPFLSVHVPHPKSFSVATPTIFPFFSFVPLLPRQCFRLRSFCELTTPDSVSLRTNGLRPPTLIVFFLIVTADIRHAIPVRPLPELSCCRWIFSSMFLRDFFSQDYEVHIPLTFYTLLNVPKYYGRAVPPFALQCPLVIPCPALTVTTAPVVICYANLRGLKLKSFALPKPPAPQSPRSRELLQLGLMGFFLTFVKSIGSEVFSNF